MLNVSLPLTYTHRQGLLMALEITLLIYSNEFIGSGGSPVIADRALGLQMPIYLGFCFVLIFGF